MLWNRARSPSLANHYSYSRAGNSRPSRSCYHHLLASNHHHSCVPWRLSFCWLGPLVGITNFRLLLFLCFVVHCCSVYSNFTNYLFFICILKITTKSIISKKLIRLDLIWILFFPIFSVWRVWPAIKCFISRIIVFLLSTDKIIHSYVYNIAVDVVDHLLLKIIIISNSKGFLYRLIREAFQDRFGRVTLLFINSLLFESSHRSWEITSSWSLNQLFIPSNSSLVWLR